MRCIYPVHILNGELSVMIRCGKCQPCRVYRKQGWVGRLVMERSQHDEARFLTLTYEDDPGVLDYRDIQNFLKRYRKHAGPCRYFAVGEYGGRTGRGHWHLIIFGHRPDTIGHLHGFKPWTAGYTYDGTCTLGSIGYVAGYTLKATDKLRPPIVRMSLRPGLGFHTVATLAQKTAKTVGTLQQWPNRVHLGGKSYPLTQGAFTHFQEEYLKAGGQPPVDNDPELRHQVSRAHVSELGTRLQAEVEAKRRLDMEKPDGTIKGRRIITREIRKPKPFQPKT